MDPSLFDNIENKVEVRFQTLAADVQDKIRETNEKHLSAVIMALDTLRNLNATQEAERCPEFREQMQRKAVRSKYVLHNTRICISRGFLALYRTTYRLSVHVHLMYVQKRLYSDFQSDLKQD